MRLYSITGKPIYKNVNKYRIKWEGKSRSNIQFVTKQFLKPFWVKMICYEEFPVFGSRMKVDILNASKKIAIEVSGDQHFSYNSFYHNNSRLNYLYSIQRDYKKEAWLEKNGYKLAIIKQDEIKDLSQEWFEQKFGFKLV